MSVIIQRQSQQGASVVEFALVLPLFLLLLFAIVDFGMYFYTQHTMQYATREGMRLALVGGRVTREEELLDRKDSIITTIKEQASLALDPSRLEISIFELHELPADAEENSVFVDPPDWQERQDAGRPGKFMRVRTQYDYTFLTPFIGSLFPNNSIRIEAQTTYRNELFDES